MRFKKTSLTKVLRYLLFIPALAAIVIAGFQLFINQYLEPFLKKKITNIVVTGSDSLYRCKIGDLKIDFWANRATVKDFSIRVDSTRYKTIKKAKKLPGVVLEADLAKCSVNGIKLFALLFSKKIIVDEIVSENASVRLYRYFRSSEEPSKKEKETPLWKKLQPDIRKIHVGHVILSRIRLSYHNVDSAKAFRWSYDNLSATLKDIQIDSAHYADTSRMLYTEDLSLKMQGLRLQTEDGLYKLHAQEVFYSSFSKRAEISRFSLQPAVSKAVFYKKVGFEKDLFTMSFPLIRFTNLRLPRWFVNNEICTDTILLQDPLIDVYKDRTASADKRNKRGKYPHQLLRKAPFVVRIGRMNIDGGRILFTEKHPETKQEGKLRFHNVRGHISNITNHMGDLEKSAVCTANLYSTFMKKSRLHAVFTFLLKSETGRFRVNADLRNLTAGQINPLTVPLGKVKLESFQLHELHYSLTADDNGSSGDVRMLYDNLKLNVLKQDEDSKNMKKKGFLSFLANELVIYPSNPFKDREVRTAQNIRLERNVQKGFFNIIWKTLFEGVKEIVVRKGARNFVKSKDRRSADFPLRDPQPLQFYTTTAQ